MRAFPKTLVLYLDGVADDQGEVFDPKGLVFEPEVYITSDPGSACVEHVIGRAKLYLGDDGNLYADIAVMEYVDGPAKLYPSVIGVVMERQHNLLVRTRVNGLGLTTKRNSDKRIEPIELPARTIDPFNADTWDGPPSKFVIPMCKLAYPRISNESLVEQPGEELNPKDG